MLSLQPEGDNLFHAARFADARLQRSGRCHESEIRAALKGEMRRFRSPDSLSSSALRDMIRCALTDKEHLHPSLSDFGCQKCRLNWGLMHSRSITASVSLQEQ